MKLSIVSLLLLILSSSTIAQIAPLPSNVRPGYESITADDLKKHVFVLAADSMEGRETTFPGQKKAAAYIASEFARLRLKPMGEGGSYFQPFDVSITRIDPSTSVAVTLPGTTLELRWGSEFVSEAGRDTILTARAAFIGHTDCELTDTDRSLLDGRMVFVFAGKRELAGDTSRIQVMRRLFAQRREPGAAAIFIIADDQGPASIGPIVTTVKNFGVEKGTMRIGAARTQPAGSPLRLFISAAVADQILRSSGHSVAELRTKARATASISPLLLDNVSLTIRSRVIRETRQTENVAGMLEGSDPALKDQVVVFTAHYDHLGKRGNGVVYPGADDDASGTSAVIELAQSFAVNPTHPRRSILFMTVTGEEKGLLGSSYYSSTPLIPFERTMADLNIDMIGRVDSAHAAKANEGYIYVIGSNKISTELDSVLVAANRETERIDFDYTFNDDNDPNQFYRRSDHYNFARFGVPVVFFFSGVHSDYHQPGDTPEKLLYERMARVTRVAYMTGWKLAEMPRLLLKNVPQEKK